MNSIFSRRVVVDSSSRFTKLLANPTSAHSHPPNHHHSSFTSLYRPSQTRHFRTRYLPSTPSPPPASRCFDPSLLWRSEKIRGFFASALTKNNKSAKVGNLVESKVWFFRSQFPKKGFEFGGYSARRGWKNWLQGLSSNDVVLGLLIANTGVFLMWRVFDQRFMINNFMISLDNVTSGRLHTLITSAFSHIDIGHIVSNMIGLYFFGTSIARNFGPQFLLKLYFAGALGGSVFYLIHHAYLAASSPKGHGAFVRDPSRTPGLGASGAVNAIMLLDIFLNPRATLYLEFFIPVPAMLLGIFIIGKDILRITQGDSNISGSAHLGGAAVAAIAWAGIRRGRFRF
ncbi:RHOMBOID-like protein 12 [Hirschfeldia incana]|nr:RHOMBOID-like protein 12 [Hirschfeldia incana]